MIILRKGLLTVSQSYRLKFRDSRHNIKPSLVQRSMHVLDNASECKPPRFVDRTLIIQLLEEISYKGRNNSSNKGLHSHGDFFGYGTMQSFD